MAVKGSGAMNEVKGSPCGRDDMGIDVSMRVGSPPKGSGEVNMAKGQKTGVDSVTGKTKNTIGENLK